MTGQLLGFARGGKYEVKTSQMNELIRKSVDMFGRTKKEISLHLKLDEKTMKRIFDRLKSVDPDIRVLLSSGYSINGQAQNILDKGCVGFIQKPFTVNPLRQKLREIPLNAAFPALMVMGG